MSRLSIQKSDKSKSKKPPNIIQTKSQLMQQQGIGRGGQTAQLKQTAEWYDHKCAAVFNRVPGSVPLMKNSEPYRLVVQRVGNLAHNKKSSSSIPYLQITATFLTTALQPISKTCFYQSEVPINTTTTTTGSNHNNNSNSDKLAEPICFYYHSRIEKNCRDVRILLRFCLKGMGFLLYVEFRDGVVDAVTHLGVGLVELPFVQDQVKNAPIYRQCSQLQLTSQILQTPTTSTHTFTYTIQSKLQLKPLTKFLPPQTITTHQDHITGLLNQYPPKYKEDAIEEQEPVFVNVGFCQVQIVDKFQEGVVGVVEGLRRDGLGGGVGGGGSGSGKGRDGITGRKIVCGFHNQWQVVMPVLRNLDYLGKQATGQYTMLCFQALGQNQTLKIPYYPTNTPLSSLTFSLIYTIGQTDYQVAIFAFTPVQTTTTPQQISMNMIIGNGEGILGNLLPIKSNRPPTILLEYVMEESRERERGDQERKESQRRVDKSMKNLKQSTKFIEQLQRQRLNLQKQKQQIEQLRTQNYINYQDEFQKKLLQQREQLRVRQEMIENQYREEVEREIRQKLELENQIRIMKEKIAAIQEGQKGDMASKKMSYLQSPAQFDPNYTSSFNNNFPAMRHKVNPNYLLQQEKTIPLNEVRDMMAKTFQKNRDTLQKQLSLFNTASKFTFLFSSIIWSPNITPPKSFYLILKFFNFNQFTSDPLTHLDTGSQYHQLIRVNHYTYNLQNTAPSYQFIVDPSQYANPEIVQEDLVNYLARNCVIVDLFDAENYLYIGQINVRMGDLFRGGKSQVMIAKEFNVVRLKGQEHYGVIQILIKNQMLECKQQISVLQKRKKKQLKKKIVSNNPILLTKQIFENEKVAISSIGSKHTQQGRNRQQKRIEMYKKKIAEGKKKDNFDQVQNNQKGKVIQKIYQYKEKQKPEFIRKVYEDLLTETISINPYFGQTKTFLYQFTNMSQNASSFRVSFQGDEKQLSLVQDSQEWKYYVSQNRYPSPKIYDSINNQNSFYLSPGQTIPLIFKYLSFSPQNQSPKSTTVTITKQQNNWIVGGFTLNIESHQSIINHSYILYQPGDQVIDLIIPVIFSSNDARIPKRLFLTVEEASAEWVGEYEIMLRVRMPPIMNMLKFNMLLYEDDYFCVLRENWLIQLHAYEGVYAVAKTDQKTRFKISLPEYVCLQLKPHRLQFYSSHPDLIFQDQKIQGSRLARGSIQNWCQLLPGKTAVGAIQITCIDEKKELLYGWIVQVYPYSAKIS